MDALMDSSVPLGDLSFASWDFVIQDGIVPYISGSQEEDQIAQLAVFIQQGLIPELSTVGVNWTGFLTKELSFDGLDAQIRNSLISAGDTKHVVSYSAIKDNMVVTLERTN